MESLVPCSICRRHVRRHEAQCRFCGAERTPSARPSGECVIPRDVKRATIFALGLALATQACGGQSEGANDPIPSGTGASTGTGDGGSGGGGGSFGGSGGSAGALDDNPYINQIPPYGAMPPRPEETGGSGGNTSLPDAGNQDAGSGDAGNSDAGPDDAGN